MSQLSSRKRTNAFDEGLTVDVVYLDFMKAYGRVPYKQLLEKVSSNKIGGRVLN